MRKLASLPPDERVATCVIVQGELMYMVHKSQRQAENQRLVEGFLQTVEVYPIDGETADIYGRLKTALIDHFGPKERARRRKTTIENLGFGENDLWIAAVAIRHGLVVVSTDSDFQRIKYVWALSVEKWVA